MRLKEFHIWEFPLTKVYVCLKKNVRERLINEAISASNQIIDKKTRRRADKLGIILQKRAVKYGLNVNYNSRIIFHWRTGETYMPLWVIVELSNFLSNKNFSLHRLEKSIVSYKADSHSEKITPYYRRKYLFPLKLRPELVALYFHMVGDGCSTKKSTVSYCQLERKNREAFTEKLKICFGDFDSSLKLHDKYIMLFPVVFIHILSHIFQVNSFASNKARIPCLIKKLPDLHKLAGILALIVDEGYISDSLQIASSNKYFINDIKDVLKSIGYGSAISFNKTRNNYIYILRIKNEDIQKLYRKYSQLVRKYPLCSLLRKEVFLRILTKVNKEIQGKSYSQQKREAIRKSIMRVLKENPLKTNELRKEIFNKYNEAVSYTALCRWLRKLEEENLVIHHNQKLSQRVWYLTNDFK